MADPRTAFLITTDKDHEGGFQKDPDDHANWSSGVIGQGTLIGTNFGITALDMPGVDIEHITQEQAIAYYIEHYWKSLYSQVTDQNVINKLADLGVLFGVGTAVGVFQLTLGVTVDHSFGPATLEATNQAEPTSLLKSYKANMVTHAFNVATANPIERPNLSGWGRRINL